MTLINVCGAARSGTTMLDLMLGNAPDAFSCGEVYARFRPWRLHHFRANCRCGKVPCPIWEKFGGVPESQFHAAVLEKMGVDFVIDSSKDLCWLIDTQGWAITNGIQVFKLLLWKNPINLAYSHWKRSGKLSTWRHEFVSYYGKFFETGLPFRSVYFNDLVSDPQRKLAETCAAVGMPYFDGKERFWDKQHHHLFGSQGTYKQAVSKKSRIRASETFSPEFEKHMDTLSRQIAEDSRVQQIIQVLQQTDVSLDHKEQASVVRKPYPLWYYVKRARRAFRRYFPEQTSGVE